MSRPLPPLSPEARALLDAERAFPAQTAAVRQRVLGRARAALAAAPQRATAAPAAPHGRRWFLATTLTCAAAAAAGLGAYELRARVAAPAARAPEVARPPQPSAPQPVAPAPVAAPRLAAPLPAVEPEGRAPVESRSAAVAAAPAPAGVDSLRLELRLLRQARAAVARDDFAGALVPIAEHARRFKEGRHAEEREALRVKALSGMGRRDEARRAAAAFKARFPRSVLLPAVNRLAATEP